MMVVVIVLGCLCILLLIYMFWEAKQLKIRREELYMPDWPQGFDGIRILFIADLHQRLIPEDVRSELRAEKLDLVLIGGDIVDRGVSFEKVRDNLRFLRSLAPSYFVWGNNDYEVDYRQLDQLIREEGVTILDNRAVSFEAGQDCLWLIGVDDHTLERDRLDLALKDIEQPGYRLLLSHDPMMFKKLTKEDDIKGIFSGHTHGGQICFPVVGPLLGAEKGVFPKYVAGEYDLEKGTIKLFISKGVGTSKLPLRLLAMPELHIFTMKAKK